MISISSSTRTTGILGYPLAHTLSPTMQNAAFGARKLDMVYLPFVVRPGEIRAALQAVRVLGMPGVNITIPYKETALSLVDRLDPSARKIGSVNTVLNRRGMLTGYNTDAPGFLDDLAEQGIDPRGKTVLVLGAGGAARAIVFALSRAGARKIHVANRGAARARRLAAEVPRTIAVPFSARKDFLPGADILINATSVGMHPEDPSPVSARELPPTVFVYDVVYHRRTRLLAEAKKAGARASGGLGMLLHQGARAFELWTGQSAPLPAMRAALHRAL